MRWSISKSAPKAASRLAFATVVAGLLTTAQATNHAANAATLHLGGTGSSLGMLEQVGGDFATAAGGAVKINVVPSLGSSGAIRALADGKLDLAVSARPLKPAEAARGLQVVLTLRTPFVLVTSRAKPPPLKVAELPKIFSADRPAWADGKPIRLILRPESETDTTLLGDMTPGLAQAIHAARHRGEIPIAATDQDNLAMAQRVPGSLTGTTLAQLTTEPNNLHIIAVDGVEPTLANLESGAYRFGKELYVVLGDKSPPEARKFAAFLRSPQGLKALRAAAVVPDKR